MLERRKQWSFLVADENTWFWRVSYPDGAEQRSQENFYTLRACIENAALHGYTFWSPDQERRADRRLPPAASARTVPQQTKPEPGRS